MSGEEIRFTRNSKDVRFELDKEADNNLKKKDKKALKPLFEAIIKSDGSRKVSKEEMKMLRDLQTIFANTGSNTDGSVIDADDIKLAEEFQKSGKDIKTFIDEKITKINNAIAEAKKREELNKEIDDIVESWFQSDKAESEISKVDDAPKQEPPKQEVPKQEPPKPHVPTQAEKNAQFNKAMQNLTKKFDKATYTTQFTKEVEVTKPLYTIAKEALQAEGNQNPSAREINDRIAQIALVNNLKDVNNVPRGTKIKVGSGVATPPPAAETPAAETPAAETPAAETPAAETPAQSEAPAQPAQPEAPAQPAQSEAPAQPAQPAQPVPALTGGVTVTKDPDVSGDWIEKTENLPEGLPSGEALNGGELKTYTKGTGDQTETKFVYEKDGIKVEANNIQELNGKIATIKDALSLIEANKAAPENETEEAKSARQAKLQAGIDALMSLGTESAVKAAQTKLNENKAQVSADFYAEKTIAMIKSGNPALIAQMFGSEGEKFADVVNNNPQVQQAVGEVIKQLNAKFNNDEYLTLDEQNIKAILDKCVGKDGVSITAKDAVAEVKDESGNVTTPAQPKVFGQTMVTDKEGNSYYKAISGEVSLNDVEFRAKDSAVLQSFLTELEAATDAEKKTALFKKYVEMENADPELVKSLAQNASKFNADFDTVQNLINNSNLDVVYAMDTSHFEDTDEEATSGTPASRAKTDITNVINARINTIMTDESLRALPENAKYLDRIKELDITGRQTDITELTDLSGYASTSEEVATGEKDASGNDIKVTVTKYSKEGKPDVFKVEYTKPTTAGRGTIIAASQEEGLKLKKDLEALALTRPEGDVVLTAEQKRENLDKLIKIAEIRPTDGMYADVAKALKDGSLVDKNDPDAKALVQKLLLTRNATVVRELTSTVKDGGQVYDNTLFENDPVAFKTLAAMLKEIRDLENQGVKLTPEQIALKDVLLYCVTKDGTAIDNGNVLRFDSDGNLAVYNSDWSGGNNGGAVAMNSAQAENYNCDSVLNDPILSKDKHALATWVTTVYGLSSADKDTVIKFINLDTVDAELLSYIDFEKLYPEISEEDKKAIQEAYIAKAKALFTYDTPAEGTKLNPANARYLSTILDTIDDFSEEDGGADADDAAINEILGQFFETTGEGEEAVTTIKNFRRFTCVEMAGLADAVANRGTAEQNAALANMITIDDMENGQFARAIEDQYDEGSHIDNAIRARYTELVEAMTTAEDALAFINKIAYPYYHLPSVDKIMEKFGDDAEIQKYLITRMNLGMEISDENKVKLLKTCMQDDGSGNITFDKTKLPEGITVEDVINVMPANCKEGDAAKIFKAVFMTLDLSDENLLKLVQCEHKADSEMNSYLATFVNSEAVQLGTTAGNRYINYLISAYSYSGSEEFFEQLYQNATDAKKADLIDLGYASDNHVLVQEGDSIDKIIKNYLKNHMELFPRLQETASGEKFFKYELTDKRKDMILNSYMNDFRDDILSELGITDPTQLKVGQIIELDKINWDNHQPGWWDYNILY